MSQRKPTSRKKPPKDETKEAKFTRVVTPRVTKAVKSITLIGNCAGSGYDYTPEQAGQIIIALSEAVNVLANRFTSKKEKQPEFAFKGPDKLV